MNVDIKELGMKIRIAVIAGARPNFMKIAPLMKIFNERQDEFEAILIHTGQHYDAKLSDVFFKQLGIPQPDIHLNVGSGTHAQQTARLMEAFEPQLIALNPHYVLVVGDVNSTIACALVAVKRGVPVIHVESGLRSGDRSMPEEINRILTDAISEMMFVSEPAGMENLAREGVDPQKCRHVGNVMIDTLIQQLPAIEQSNIGQRLNCSPRGYGVLTLHRPSNVDERDSLTEVYNILLELSTLKPLICPVHPRTYARMEEFGLKQDFEAISGLRLIEPLGYHDFIALVKNSAFVLTDSGGIQEETTYLKVPCLTMRENTERPSTIEIGSNRLVQRSVSSIIPAVQDLLIEPKLSGIPELWDGLAAQRIVDCIAQHSRAERVLATV
jgi:UDP-N-acetylglucosamine 2-epimerase (non-hydrolysing)